MCTDLKILYGGNTLCCCNDSNVQSLDYRRRRLKENTDRSMGYGNIKTENASKLSTNAPSYENTDDLHSNAVEFSQGNLCLSFKESNL